MHLAHQQACWGWKFYDENRIFVPWVLAILLPCISSSPLLSVCVCVLCGLRAWEQVCVQCALIVLVRVHLCVIGLHEMEKARRTFAQGGGGGCTMKNEQRLPSDCVYIWLQPAALRGSERRDGGLSGEEMHIILPLLGSKKKTRAMGRPSKIMFTWGWNSWAESQSIVTSVPVAATERPEGELFV